MTSVHYRFIYATCGNRAQPFIIPNGPTRYFLYINDLRETKNPARRPKDLNDIIMMDETIEEVKKQGKSLD